MHFGKSDINIDNNNIRNSAFTVKLSLQFHEKKIHNAHVLHKVIKHK
jgi:hypothetical protein